MVEVDMFRVRRNSVRFLTVSRNKLSADFARFYIVFVYLVVRSIRIVLCSRGVVPSEDRTAHPDTPSPIISSLNSPTFRHFGQVTSFQSHVRPDPYECCSSDRSHRPIQRKLSPAPIGKVRARCIVLSFIPILPARPDSAASLPESSPGETDTLRASYPSPCSEGTSATLPLPALLPSRIP